MNKIDPTITHNKFTTREDILILQLYLENKMYADVKSRWHYLAHLLNVKIAESETGSAERARRSEIQIKNRFKCLLYKCKGVEITREVTIKLSQIHEMIADLESQLKNDVQHSRDKSMETD